MRKFKHLEYRARSKIISDAIGIIEYRESSTIKAILDSVTVSETLSNRSLTENVAMSNRSPYWKCLHHYFIKTTITVTYSDTFICSVLVWLHPGHIHILNSYVIG